MKKLLLLFLFIFDIHERVVDGEDLLGPADADIKSIQQCDNPEQYPVKMYITYSKLNRTHDVINGNLSIPMDWDDSIGVNFNAAKWGDGGYKPNYFILDDAKSCLLIMQYLKNNLKNVLRESNMSETCPVNSGTIVMKNYLIDYKDLPDVLMYGNFRIDVYFYKPDGTKIACVKIFANTKPKKLFIG